MASATPGRIPVWAVPLSLAATDGIDVSFFSSRYLDVSVPWVRSARPMHSGGSDRLLHRPGFPIRRSPDQRSFASFPELIAGYNVLRRLSMPRHPPYTLSSLTTFIDHRHVGLPRPLLQQASASWTLIRHEAVCGPESQRITPERN